MIIIKISTKNAAFHDDYGGEIARILMSIARDFDYQGSARSTYNDINGNKVVTVEGE